MACGALSTARRASQGRPDGRTNQGRGIDVAGMAWYGPCPVALVMSEAARSDIGSALHQVPIGEALDAQGWWSSARIIIERGQPPSQLNLGRVVESIPSPRPSSAVGGQGDALDRGVDGSLEAVAAAGIQSSVPTLCRESTGARNPISKWELPTRAARLRATRNGLRFELHLLKAPTAVQEY